MVGPPVDEEAWVHNVFARWQFATSFFAPQGAAWAMDGVHVTDAELMSLLGPVATVADAVGRIDAILTGGVMTDNEICVIEAYVNVALASCAPCTTAQVMQIVRTAFALAASCPTFQYH